MATSRLNQEDAQEWLESLQQVGEGWYRQVALAVRAGAHKALGMERREFAAQIGQRMIDPREAIVELYKEGHSQTAIADVLHVSREWTVARILVEEGLAQPRALSGPAGADSRNASGPGGADVESTAEEVDPELLAEIERLRGLVESEQAEKEKLQAAKEKLQERLKEIAVAERDRILKIEADMTDADKERALSEIEALTETAREPMRVLAVHVHTKTAVSALHEAHEAVNKIVSEGITEEALTAIGPALAAVNEEYEVAKGMSKLDWEKQR